LIGIRLSGGLLLLPPDKKVEPPLEFFDDYFLVV
jgi:hypothetical protein